MDRERKALKRRWIRGRQLFALGFAGSVALGSLFPGMEGTLAALVLAILCVAGMSLCGWKLRCPRCGKRLRQLRPPGRCFHCGEPLVYE